MLPGYPLVGTEMPELLAYTIFIIIITVKRKDLRHLPDIGQVHMHVNCIVKKEKHLPTKPIFSRHISSSQMDLRNHCCQNTTVFKIFKRFLLLFCYHVKIIKYAQQHNLSCTFIHMSNRIQFFYMKMRHAILRKKSRQILLS